MYRIAVVICLHALFWITLVLAPGWMLGPMPPQMEPPPGHRVFEFVYYPVLMAIFYLNFFRWIPNYLRKKAIGWYFLIFCGCFLLWLGVLGLDQRGHLPRASGADWPHRELPPPGGNPQRQYEFSRVLTFFIVWLTSMGARYMIDLRKTEQRLSEAENARLRMELEQLKGQLNPHFLFNVLNGLHVLALEKSDEAAGVVMHLGDLLRYLLEDTQHSKVPLEKDLNHLTNFVELHKIRLGDNVKVHFDTNGDVRGWLVPPLLFVVLVENAFKYGVSTANDANITIQLTVETDGQLRFFCQNQIFHGVQSGTQMGLNNLRRRLELLFPNQHTLNIQREKDLFTASLRVQLTEKATA